MRSFLLKKITLGSKEPTVITTADGKAESTEQATVYGKDLDVFVTMMLLRDSPALLLLGLLCEEIGLLLRMETGKVSIID